LNYSKLYNIDAFTFYFILLCVLGRYENKRVPVDDPERFRVELSFSDGSAISPFDVSSLSLLPPRPVSFTRVL
jgi:hypothetical protein